MKIRVDFWIKLYDFYLSSILSRFQNRLSTIRIKLVHLWVNTISTKGLWENTDRILEFANLRNRLKI
jgi:hypothetical protein